MTIKDKTFNWRYSRVWMYKTCWTYGLHSGHCNGNNPTHRIEAMALTSNHGDSGSSGSFTIKPD